MVCVHMCCMWADCRSFDKQPSKNCFTNRYGTQQVLKTAVLWVCEAWLMTRKTGATVVANTVECAVHFLSMWYVVRMRVLLLWCNCIVYPVLGSKNELWLWLWVCLCSIFPLMRCKAEPAMKQFCLLWTEEIDLCVIVVMLHSTV